LLFSNALNNVLCAVKKTAHSISAHQRASSLISIPRVGLAETTLSATVRLRTFLTRTGFVNPDSTAIKLGLVQRSFRRLSSGLGIVFNEAEALSLNDGHGSDITERGELNAQRILGSSVSEVTNVEPLRHKAPA
jgi:hypothetical protein